ncbi:MAG: DUF4163 domain-containing protein [Sporomusaceae bacterium]|nr:DUF4163 domain-containing protein [Sporomusaceae bacterium]
MTLHRRVTVLLLALCFGTYLLLTNTQFVSASGVLVETYDYQGDYITMTYPHFDGMTNQNSQEKMNKYIEDAVVNSFINGIQNTVNDLSSRGFMKDSYGGKMTYKVQYIDDDFASLTIETRKDFGGAHPMRYTTGYTFNLKTGDLVPFPQIIRWDAQCRQVIYDNIVQNAKDRNLFLYPREYPTNVAKMVLENARYVPNYCLTGKGKFTVIFQPYDIAPYSSGTLFFEMTYK